MSIAIMILATFGLLFALCSTQLDATERELKSRLKYNEFLKVYPNGH